MEHSAANRVGLKRSGVLGKLPEIEELEEINDEAFADMRALLMSFAIGATPDAGCFRVPDLCDIPKIIDTPEGAYLHRLAAHFTPLGGTPGGMVAHLVQIDMPDDMRIWEEIIASLSGGTAGESALLGYAAVRDAVNDNWPAVRAWFDLRGGAEEEDADLRRMACEIVTTSGIARQASSAATARRKQEAQEAKSKTTRATRR